MTLTLIATLMIISPGPDFAVVVNNSLLFGRRTGLSTTLGIVFANLLHVMLNILGIGLLISQSPIAFSILKMLSAAYLIYLGCKGIFAKPNQSEATLDNTNPQFMRKGFINGFTTSVLNPKACLFYLSLFSVLLSPETQFSTKIMYGIWICCIALLWFSLVSCFFTAPVIGKKLQSIKHWIERIAGSVLILLGVRLFF